MFTRDLVLKMQSRAEDAAGSPVEVRGSRQRALLLRLAIDAPLRTYELGWPAPAALRLRVPEDTPLTF